MNELKGLENLLEVHLAATQTTLERLEGSNLKISDNISKLNASVIRMTERLLADKEKFDRFESKISSLESAVLENTKDLLTINSIALSKKESRKWILALGLGTIGLLTFLGYKN